MCHLFSRIRIQQKMKEQINNNFISQFRPVNSGLCVSVADSYKFDTDPNPDPGCEKIRYGSGSKVNFETDPDPGNNDTVRIQQKWTKYH